MDLVFTNMILFLHSRSGSCGKIRLHSTQTASWVLMALNSTSWRGRRLWLLAWESGAASARSLHEMKSTSFWQSWSRSCTSAQFLESRWTWPQNTVSQWSTNAATWEPQCERGMSSECMNVLFWMYKVWLSRWYKLTHNTVWVTVRLMISERSVSLRM